MQKDRECSYCEEIWYDSQKETFVYEIETCEWSDWEDGYVKEIIHINYCFHCGTPYEMNSLITMMNGFIDDGADAFLKETLANCSKKRVEALKDALLEKIDAIRYAELEGASNKLIRAEQFKKILDEKIGNF